MKKAAVIAMVLVLLVSGTTVFAADGVVYSDEELGFTFEMPADFEYYGDCLSHLSAEQSENIEKQPMYVGYDSNVSITYGKGSDEFEQLAKHLPDGITEQELDFYMMPGKDKDEFIQSLVDGVQDMELGIEVVSTEWIDYGGKLCAFMMLEGRDEASGLDYYQGSLSFMYKHYFISLTYTKINGDGFVAIDDAQDEFEECFETLEFDIVPSDKDVQLKSQLSIRLEALLRILLDVAIVAGIVILIIWLVKRKKKGLGLK